MPKSASTARRQAGRESAPEEEKPSVPTAEVQEDSPPGAGQDEVSAEAAFSEEVEVEMPTVENDPPSLFKPKPGCKILDVFEIALMYLLQLSGSQLNVAPGTLRSVALPAERVNQLSDLARQHMEAMSTDPNKPPAT